MPDAAVEQFRRARMVRAVVANAGFVAVVVILGAGMVLVGLEYWRRGLYVFGAGTGFAAFLRAFLPERRQGLLRVRSRVFDVTAARGGRRGDPDRGRGGSVRSARSERFFALLEISSLDRRM